MNDVKLYDKGLEEYPKSTIIISNFTMLLWIALGTIACWFLEPLLGWTYLAIAVLMVFIILRKLVCTNCYYYGKWCCNGWGKLSALFFKKGNIKKFNNPTIIKLVFATYGLLALVPILVIIYSMFLEFSMLKLGILIALVLVSGYSGAVARKKSCAQCKMRLMCAGCAVK